MSLVARNAEASGLATVVVGSARDIVETVAVPRFLFVDYPLGNPTGKPFDLDDQRSITDQALALAVRAWAPQTTVTADATWDDTDDGWRHRFMEVNDANRAELAAAGEQRRAAQASRRAAK